MVTLARRNMGSEETNSREKEIFFFFKGVGQFDNVCKLRESELITINQTIQIIHVSHSVATWAKQER